MLAAWLAWYPWQQMDQHNTMVSILSHRVVQLRAGEKKQPPSRVFPSCAPLAFILEFRLLSIVQQIPALVLPFLPCSYLLFVSYPLSVVCFEVGAMWKDGADSVIRHLVEYVD